MTNEELCALIQQGNDDKMDDLYRQNVNLIRKTVSKYSCYADVEDLMQEAYFGLFSAAKLFDYNSGAAFSTYAVYWLKCACARYVDTCSGVVRVPVNQRQRIAQYRREVNRFQVQFSRDPSPKELMTALQITKDQLRQLRQDITALSVRSMSEPISDDEDAVTLGDTIADPENSMDKVLDDLQNEELAGVLWALVDALETDEAAVIRARYIDGMQYGETAEALGMRSAGAVRNTTEKALKKLRIRGRSKLLPFRNESVVYSMGLKNNGLGAFLSTWTSGTEAAALQLAEGGR